MSMNSDFGDWYRAAGIRPESIPLSKRWEAVESLDVDAGEISLLAQVFYRLNPSDPEFPRRFRKAFNETDPSFAMSGNDRELMVLAGAGLVDAIDRRARDIADLAAFCLVCGAVQNVRAADIPQIPEIAAKYLSKRSVERAKPKQDGEEDNELAPELQKLLLEFPIVSEETNMLWWLISETSRDVSKRWSEMPLGMVCTLSGKELADLTRILPGPIAARAFLDRAVRSGRDEVADSISVADVVNKTEKTWRGSHFSKSLPAGLEGILPVTHAVILSVHASEDKAWRPIFKTATGIAATAKTSPDAISHQFYLEQLAVRSFTEMKES